MVERKTGTLQKKKKKIRPNVLSVLKRLVAFHSEIAVPTFTVGYNESGGRLAFFFFFIRNE